MFCATWGIYFWHPKRVRNDNFLRRFCGRPRDPLGLRFSNQFHFLFVRLQYSFLISFDQFSCSTEICYQGALTWLEVCSYTETHFPNPVLKKKNFFLQFTALVWYFLKAPENLPHNKATPFSYTHTKSCATPLTSSRRSLFMPSSMNFKIKYIFLNRVKVCKVRQTSRELLVTSGEPILRSRFHHPCRVFEL